MDRKMSPFLKPIEQFEVGDYMTDISVGDRHGDIITLHSLITDHLMLIILSDSCEPCFESLNAVAEFAETREQANIVVLLSSDEETMLQVRQGLPESVKLFGVDYADIGRKWKTYRFPWGYCLNRKGQILTSKGVGAVDLLAEAYRPFLRQIDPVPSP
ncbi:hypothetical protein [Paenibacillus sp. MMS18-CY102]|uniref:hypothetical protein n=1 Tax=Paenibacillus sp. MMS18-CY102 TaxID=2682849 RepID=UPI001365CAB0|nr:hypothetical protein [Paenibacillus sp. MMS18-CY102]MWC28562.1 hypothetical protein [Paenibacillus sp. MMS18-CY102]